MLLGVASMKNSSYSHQMKFENVAGFGTKIKGHIFLTEQHDEASFRNLKIRGLFAQ